MLSGCVIIVKQNVLVFFIITEDDKNDLIALEECHKSSQMLLSVQKEPTEKNDCGNSLETINDDRFLQHSKKKTEDNNNTIEAFSTTDLPLVFAKCPYSFFVCALESFCRES